MRVAQFIDSLDAGGAERMAVSTANELSRKIDCSLLIVSRKEGILKEQILEGVSYEFLSKKSAYDVISFWRLIVFLKKYEIDILHAHSSSYFWASLSKICIPKLKVIWHDHYGNSEELESRPLGMLKRSSRFFSGVVVVNQLLLDWNQRNLHCNKILYLKNFVSLPKIDKKNTQLEGVNGKRIVCLANLRPQKNHVLLLSAFSKIKKKYPDWTVHLVGKNFSDKYADSLMQYINENKLMNQVFLYGSREDVSYILSQATIGVLSSKSEGLPLALLEYGIHKLPSIATKVGQCEEVLGNNGILVASDSQLEMVNALDIMMSDSILREKTAIAFHEHVLNNYGVDQQIHALKEFYEEIF